MTAISITELPALVSKFSQADGSAKPLGIITPDYDTKRTVLRYLEEESGGRRITALTVGTASQYFDSEGNLKQGVENLDQKLMDRGTCNAAKYLASLVDDFKSNEGAMVYTVFDVYPTPDMEGAARYIAREAGRPLVALLPPVKDPATTYADYDVVICKK